VGKIPPRKGTPVFLGPSTPNKGKKGELPQTKDAVKIYFDTELM